MNRDSSHAVYGCWPVRTVNRFCLLMCLVGSSLLLAGCTRNQMKSLLDSVDNSAETTQETVEAPVGPVAQPQPAAQPKPAAQAKRANPRSDFYVDPGSGRDIKLLAGFRMLPPETFNVIEESEGDDFRSNFKHFRWERLSGGTWFIVTFLSGMDYEGARTPKIEDERVVLQRIKVAFARVDEKHQLRSNGSQTEKLAGLSTIRTNVIGKVHGEDAIGHLYLLSDGKHLIEIVALATEPNRGALKHCRDAANSLSRGPAKKR